MAMLSFMSKRETKVTHICLTLSREGLKGGVVKGLGKGAAPQSYTFFIQLGFFRPAAFNISDENGSWKNPELSKTSELGYISSLQSKLLLALLEHFPLSMNGG